MGLKVTDFRIRDMALSKARAMRIHVSVKDESIFDDFGRRTSRPWQEWRPLVEERLRAEGIQFERLRWSQTAGCRCPCSPGFIVVGGDTKQYSTAWITLEASEPQVENPVAELTRKLQLAAQF